MVRALKALALLGFLVGPQHGLVKGQSGKILTG